MAKVYLYYEYADVAEYQAYLRKGGHTHDNVVVDGVLYTMDEYDLNGKMISYGNKKHGKAMTIETADRYKTGFVDAVVTVEEMTSWRDDVTYAE